LSNKLLILGAKGMAKMTIEAIEQQRAYTEIALLDNYANYDRLLSFPIIGKCDDSSAFKSLFTHAFVCIGDNNARMHFLRKVIAEGFIIPNVIHPTAYISKSAVIGVGVFANAYSIVQAGCKIGNGVILGSGAIAEHDSELGECSQIGPNASTTGYVKIGERTFLGACSCVINSICIGENTIIAAGSSVISDIQSNVMAAGTPAKVKKQLTC